MTRLLSIFLILISTICYSQETSSKQEHFRIMFYNVENLFDPFHDTLKNDYEFVAGGEMGWTWKKFEHKLQNISKVIVTAGGWKVPEMVCFSEIENKFVLIQLLKRTPLERFGYRIIHEESPDERGIDVGLIYNPERFTEIGHQRIYVRSGDSVLKTRSILYVKGMIKSETGEETDTLHLFINHWPSRTGGVELTAWKRKAASLSLKTAVDSILRIVPKANIVLTGDFNDEPTDESIVVHLGASGSIRDEDKMLYALMTPYIGRKDFGTNKFRNQWGVIDQFIVSRELLSDSSIIKVNGKNAEILNFPFLLQEDEKYGGTVPKRTFVGRKYSGGFSDHLPVLLTLDINDKGTLLR